MKINEKQSFDLHLNGVPIIYIILSGKFDVTEKHLDVQNNDENCSHVQAIGEVALGTDLWQFGVCQWVNMHS